MAGEEQSALKELIDTRFDHLEDTLNDVKAEVRAVAKRQNSDFVTRREHDDLKDTMKNMQRQWVGGMIAFIGALAVGPVTWLIDR